MRTAEVSELYRVGGLGNETTFDAGSSLLLTGPSADVEPRLLDAVAPKDGERCVVITTRMGAEQVVSELREQGVDDDQIDIIDCTGQETDIEDVEVRTLNSPGDLTGISLEFAKALEDADDSTPVRVGFASVSTALMYAETRTVFRFLHVFTARIRSGEMFGVFTLDPDMHETQTYNTIRAVFDAEAELEGVDVSLRGTGYAQ